MAFLRFVVGFLFIMTPSTGGWTTVQRSQRKLSLPKPLSLKQSGSTCQSSSRLQSSALPDPEINPLFVVGVAAVLGVAAQGFINQMLEGDQGLGAYLKDGSGYNKSGFRRMNGIEDESTKDPLPWLKLPRLDFVEVAGQDPLPNQLEQLEELESLRLQMNEYLEKGKLEEATAIRNQLEGLMEDAGIEYNSDQ